MPNTVEAVAVALLLVTQKKVAQVYLVLAVAVLVRVMVAHKMAVLVEPGIHIR
jgi:hypothetical protein